MATDLRHTSKTVTLKSITDIGKRPEIRMNVLDGGRHTSMGPGLLPKGAMKKKKKKRGY